MRVATMSVNEIFGDDLMPRTSKSHTIPIMVISLDCPTCVEVEEEESPSKLQNDSKESCCVHCAHQIREKVVSLSRHM